MDAGKIFIFLGALFVLTGLALEGVLGRLGHLPGDFVYQGERVTVVIPLTTSLILSLFLSLVWWAASRWL